MMQTEHRTGHRSAAIAVGLLLTAIPTTSVLCAQDAVQWRVEDGGNGHWYVISEPESLSWQDANEDAEARNGYLVCLNSAEENQWILDRSIGWNFWIGFFQSPDAPEPAGEWQWVSGEEATYANWDVGQPSNSGLSGDEDYAHFRSANGKWNDTDGSAPGSENYVVVVEYSADCNGDGIVDYGQILDGTLSDENGNGIPDCCDQGVCLPPVQWRTEDGGNGHWYAFRLLEAVDPQRNLPRLVG